MKKTIFTTIVLLVSSVVFAADAYTPIKISNAAQQTVTAEDTLGNTNIQDAILKIDNAQVEIRNQLLDLKTKFADIDAQYVSVKAERKALKKQLNQTERRLKTLDKTKEKMRKSML